MINNYMLRYNYNCIDLRRRNSLLVRLRDRDAGWKRRLFKRPRRTDDVYDICSCPSGLWSSWRRSELSLSGSHCNANCCVLVDESSASGLACSSSCSSWISQSLLRLTLLKTPVSCLKVIHTCPLNGSGWLDSWPTSFRSDCYLLAIFT